ncbi:MAG: redoxin domain-containing protein [Salinimicrobium sp.]
MNRIFTFLIILLLGFPALAQEQVAVKRQVVRRTREVATAKLYLKPTGEKLSQKEFYALWSKNPNMAMERVINNKGEVEKILVDPGAEPSPLMNNWAEKTKPGEDFPELEFTTVEGKSLKLKDLRGKLIILHWDTDANTPRFQKELVQELDATINASPHKHEVAAILLFMNSAEQVKKGFDFQESNFSAVPDAANFTAKLNIRSFPTTLVIDKEGKLIKELSRKQQLDLEELLEQ